MKTEKKLSLPAQPNQSLLSGMECLHSLVACGHPVGSREIARELDIEPTRANRLLGTLAYMGLAQKTADGKYTPGSGLHVLAAMSLQGSKLLSAALPHLDKLSENQPNCSVALGVLWRRQVVYLYFSKPGQEARVAIASQGLYPAELSSIGQLMLAEKSTKEIRQLFKDRPASEVKTILNEIRTAKKQGFAFLGNRTLGVAIGSPVIAGLALAGPKISRHRNSLIKTITDVAQTIAKETLS
jgi:DNA-binding IclR family transcriptional regulator